MRVIERMRCLVSRPKYPLSRVCSPNLAAQCARRRTHFPARHSHSFLCDAYLGSVHLVFSLPCICRIATKVRPSPPNCSDDSGSVLDTPAALLNFTYSRCIFSIIHCTVLLPIILLLLNVSLCFNTIFPGIQRFECPAHTCFVDETMSAIFSKR